MVEVHEIRDDEENREEDDGFVTEDSNDAVSDAGSDNDTVDLFDPSQETLADRFYALRDMVTPSTRRSIASAWASSSVYAKKGIKGAGLVAWWVSTSVILLGLPLALAVESESQYAQQEKYEREAQQGAQQMMLPGAGQPASTTGQTGVLPPGF